MDVTKVRSVIARLTECYKRERVARLAELDIAYEATNAIIAARALLAEAEATVIAQKAIIETETKRKDEALLEYRAYEMLENEYIDLCWALQSAIGEGFDDESEEDNNDNQ